MLKEKLEKLVNDNLEDESHFLVDIVISSNNGPRKVLILLDGDDGITIDDCAKLSRKVGFIIEEEEIIEDAYRLEVSSPGLDHPITMLRQYLKNIGRKVRVTDIKGERHEGELLSATEAELVLKEEVGKGKKKEVNEKIFSFEEINKTEILVTF